MGNKLEGKVTVITGGGSGIGLATAKRFLSEGAYVFIIDLHKKELDSALSEIGSKNVVGIEGDVSNIRDLGKLYSAVKDQKGQLDIYLQMRALYDMLHWEKFPNNTFTI